MSAGAAVTAGAQVAVGSVKAAVAAASASKVLSDERLHGLLHESADWSGSVRSPLRGLRLEN